MREGPDVRKNIVSLKFLSSKNIILHNHLDYKSSCLTFKL